MSEYYYSSGKTYLKIHLLTIRNIMEVIMSNKEPWTELDKDERVEKHRKSHMKNNKEEFRLNRLEPKHRHFPKKDTNILDSYEKHKDDYE